MGDKTARCEIITYVVTDGTTGGGAARAEHKCQTHDMPIASIHLPGNELCPIGKIEEATEAALAKIAAALRG
jgi:hypothetical protein